MADGVDIHLVKKWSWPCTSPFMGKKKYLFQIDWRSKCEKWNSEVFRENMKIKGIGKMSFNRT